MRVLFILLPLCIAPMAWAQSSRPLTSTETKAEQQHQQLAKDGKAAGGEHVSKETANAHRDIKENSSENRNTSNMGSSSDGLWTAVSAIAAAVTAIFTVVLAKSTKKLWHETRRSAVAARTAARAARKSSEVAGESVESVRRVERAYIFVDVKPNREIDQSNLLLGTKNGALFIFGNRGKTPAILKGIRIAILATDSSPKELPENAKTRDFPRSWAIRSDGDFAYPLTVEITTADSELVRVGKRTLYCCGVVQYEDVFRNTRETGFCWRYIADEHRFKPDDNYTLNFHT